MLILWSKIEFKTNEGGVKKENERDSDKNFKQN